MSTSVPGFPTEAESTPRQVLGNELVLHISDVLREDNGRGEWGGGWEGKTVELIEEKIPYKC